MSRLPIAMQWQSDEGKPFPAIFDGLASLRALFRRGQLAMVAGPSGSGKTAFITDYALSMFAADPGVKFLFFSADSDRGTVGLRTMSSVTQYEMSDVEKLLNEKNTEGYYKRLGEATQNIWYCFDSDLTPDVINQEIAAYVDAMGCFPDIIIVDNLIDMKFDSGNGMDDHTGHANSIKWLKVLASQTRSCVIVLHHVTGQHADGTAPIPISAILGKVDRHPRLILTVWRPDDNTVGISVVKNSNGIMSRTGDIGVAIPVDLSRMHFWKQCEVVRDGWGTPDHG